MVHIYNLQKEYQLKHSEMKKIKKTFQGRFAEACRNMTKYNQEEDDMERNIDQLNL